MSVSDDFKEEFELAKKENRQPKCINCEKPLDRITQTQYDYISWKWNDETKEFEKENDDEGDSDKPKCANCGYSEWELLDQESGVNMGVSY